MYKRQGKKKENGKVYLPILLVYRTTVFCASILNAKLHFFLCLFYIQSDRRRAVRQNRGEGELHRAGRQSPYKTDPRGCGLHARTRSGAQGPQGEQPSRSGRVSDE